MTHGAPNVPPSAALSSRRDSDPFKEMFSRFELAQPTGGTFVVGNWTSSLSSPTASLSDFLSGGGEFTGRDRETGLPVRAVVAPSPATEAGVRLVLELVFCSRVDHYAVPRVLWVAAVNGGLTAVFSERDGATEETEAAETETAEEENEVARRARLTTALRRGLELAELTAAAHAARFLLLDFSPAAIGWDKTGGGLFLRRAGYATPLESVRESSRAVRRAERDLTCLAPELIQFARLPEAEAWRSAYVVAPSADVYGFGLGLLRLCGGAKTDQAAEVLRRRFGEVPPAAVRMLERCLEKEPRKRFASMRDAAQDLCGVLRELGASPPPPRFDPVAEPARDFPEEAGLQERLRGHVDRVFEFIRKTGRGGAEAPAVAGTVLFSRRSKHAPLTAAVVEQAPRAANDSPFAASSLLRSSLKPDLPGEETMTPNTVPNDSADAAVIADTPAAVAETVKTDAAQEEQSPAAALLERIQTAPRERYRILRELSLGGLGRTLIARDLLTERDVLLKTSHSGYPWTAERILKEARLIARFRHPNVLSLLEVGAFDKERIYLTLPLLEGRDLGGVAAEAAEREIPGLAGDSAAARVELFDKICAGVEHAHARGVLHLDLKPQNILVDSEGGVAVVDWGLSQEKNAPGSYARYASFPVVGDEKPTLAATLLGGVDGEPDIHALGTPAYMAPEQWDGDPERFDERTDVYGLGGVLFFLLTGSAPNMIRRYTDLEPYFAHSKTPRPSRHTDKVVPPELNDLCVHCLRRNPSRRPANVAQIRHVLRAWLSQPEVWAHHRPRTAR